MSDETSQGPIDTVGFIKTEQEFISEYDKMTIELAKAKHKIATAEAKTAELEYKYIILKIYMKYGLTVVDGISEDGTILRNHVNLEK